MTNYNILQLNAKELSELKEIANKMALKVPNSITKDKLVYEILDQQAIMNAQEKSSVSEENEGNKRKRMRIIPKKAEDQKVFSTENVIKNQPAAEKTEKVVKPEAEKTEKTEKSDKPKQQPPKTETPKADTTPVS